MGRSRKCIMIPNFFKSNDVLYCPDFYPYMTSYTYAVLKKIIKLPAKVFLGQRHEISILTEAARIFQ